MKKIVLIVMLFAFGLNGFSQLLTWTQGSTSFITEASTGNIVVTVDATKGNKGLSGFVGDVYVHTGLITSASTSPSNWKYVKLNANFNTAIPELKATSAGTNKWSFTIVGGIRAFYGVPAGESVFKITMLFRNAAGTVVQRNIDGSDMYIPVYTSALAANLTVPPKQPTYVPKPEPITKSIGNTISITGTSNLAATLKLYLNGTVVATLAAATTISATPTISVAGTQQIVLEAAVGGVTKYDTIRFFVAGNTVNETKPTSLRDGITYENDKTAVTFCLFAPGKSRVCIIGDIPGSNWEETPQYQMKKDPNGYWWLRVTGLTSGFEYSFQYLVDGNLAVADPFTEKVLDPWNDKFINTTTYTAYPNIKPYPEGFTTGIVGTFQTNQTTYNWVNTGFVRPDKRSLVIYELHLRDFIANHDFKTLIDSINYLKNLGITAVQLMPVNEFEGNNSWGYNPDFYFALDKYYGTQNDFKRFVDLCHGNGMAVILDVALNHSFGLSPMVQLYWDAALNRPATTSPWFNPVAKHGFNVGYDFNHEALPTKRFFGRVVEHWLINYKVDGFRFDLSKGFTQNQTCDNNGGNCNIGSWNSYDQSRVNIWNAYYDTLNRISPGCYPILEHFANNDEEKVLSDKGFMLWGNMERNYAQATMGFNTTGLDGASPDLSWGIFKNRGWNNPFAKNNHLITFMESHDEERISFKSLSFGNQNNLGGFYDVRKPAVYARRMELAHALLLPMPGPKMMWQFGELAYDSSINYCGNGQPISTSCRTDPKPILWTTYYKNDNSSRRTRTYRNIGNINKLRTNSQSRDLFDYANNDIFITDNMGGQYIKTLMVNNANLQGMVVVGNFNTFAESNVDVAFPFNGTWYNYLNPSTSGLNTSINVTGNTYRFSSLPPGEYRIYLNRLVALPASITKINGKNKGLKNDVNWGVNNEEGLLSFELERSEDARNFSPVAKVTATGNLNYAYEDDISTSKKSVFYYRVKLIDKDGAFRYSSVVRVSTTAKNNFVEVYPNPVIHKLNLRIDADVQERASLVISDVSGRQLLKKQIQLVPGNNAIEVEEVAKYTKGVYLVTVITSQQTQSVRVTKGN